MMFDNYRIPKDYLLNRTGDVTDEGKYVSPFSDPNKRFGEWKCHYNIFSVFCKEDQ